MSLIQEALKRKKDEPGDGDGEGGDDAARLLKLKAPKLTQKATASDGQSPPPAPSPEATSVPPPTPGPSPDTAGAPPPLPEADSGAPPVPGQDVDGAGEKPKSATNKALPIAAAVVILLAGLAWLGYVAVGKLWGGDEEPPDPKPASGNKGKKQDPKAGGKTGSKSGAGNGQKGQPVVPKNKGGNAGTKGNNTSTQPTPPVQKTWPQLKVTIISMQPGRSPTAEVNGQRVRINGTIGDVRVVSITAEAVEFEFNGQRRSVRKIKVIWPMLSITAVWAQPGKSAAVINGRLVKLGDEIEGAKVVAVTADGVKLEYKGEQKVIRAD